MLGAIGVGDQLELLRRDDIENNLNLALLVAQGSWWKVGPSQQRLAVVERDIIDEVIEVVRVEVFVADLDGDGKFLTGGGRVSTVNERRVAVDVVLLGLSLYGIDVDITVDFRHDVSPFSAILPIENARNPIDISSVSICRLPTVFY